MQSPRWYPLAGLISALLVCCTPQLPPPGVAARADTLWVPPARALAAAPTVTTPELPDRLRSKRMDLTLEDVVALALEGSPETRATWASARAGAAAYGAARGAWYPTVTGDATATRLKTSATQGRAAVQQTVYQPSVDLTWLLLDLGGRSSAISATRSALLSANWTHNATVQQVVAQTAAAYFDYAAAKALVSAQRTTLREAELNLAAAEERRRVGVATIADVLQARTAVAQARLDLEAVEGSLLTTRGALAASTGYPATLQYDIDTTAVDTPIAMVAEQVDTLIAMALRDRPDLAAARADYQAARARIDVARAQRLPSLTAGASSGLSFRPGQSGGSESYTLSLGVHIPLFNGFTWEYNRQQAAAQAEAAQARAEGLAQQVVFQVFSAYYAVRTATIRVGTAEELLTSATESAAAARGRYQGGVGTLLELLSVENALASARAQRIQARLGWQAALVQLARNAGLLDLHGQSPIRLAPSATSDSLP